MKNDSFIKRNTFGIFVSLLFVILFNASLSTAEMRNYYDSRSKLQKEVRTLLHEQKFSELENMADKFRTEKTRFPDGGWKISAFYLSFEDPYYGWDDLLQNLDIWLKLYPNSITARVATGNVWCAYAWAARGSGYADTVTEKKWNLFNDRINKAYEYVKNPPADSSKDCMHRYYVLLLIGRAQGWNRQKYEALFQKAVSFEPSYYANYFAEVFYLLPRWHGNDGEWQKFADEAVKLTPKSEGMTIYTRILMYVWAQDEFKEFHEPDISWKKMKQGFRDIDRNYPNSSFISNLFCMFACIAGDKDTAVKLFKRIGNEPDFDVWRGQANFYKWQRWAETDI